MEVTSQSQGSPAPGPDAPAARRPRRKRRWWRWLVPLVLLGAAAGGYWYYRHRQQSAPLQVQTEKVTRRNLTELVVASGRIQPVLEVKISPEVSGEIIELPVKEGQAVKKGDLLLRIKRDFYEANRNSAHANYLSAQAGETLAVANLDKAVADLKQAERLYADKLISDSDFLAVKTTHDVARAQRESANHQCAMAKASLARVEEELAKTTIVSPLTGTVSKLNSRLGERVVGTATMAGTDVMTIADLDDMEARVDIGEIDIVLIRVGQKARLEVDAFRERKFNGTVYEIGSTARTFLPGQQQEATKFEVKIRITEKDPVRPGMSVTADIETRYRTNVLSVPIQSVTTRLPKGATAPGKETPPKEGPGSAPSDSPTAASRREAQRARPVEVVFLANNGAAKSVPVERGISDQDYVEILSGLTEGQEVISGGYQAINRDLEDGKAIRIGPPATNAPPATAQR